MFKMSFPEAMGKITAARILISAEASCSGLSQIVISVTQNIRAKALLGGTVAKARLSCDESSILNIVPHLHNTGSGSDCSK
jgi:hypothetical protein